MPKRFRVEKRPPKASERMKTIRLAVNQSVNPVLDRHLSIRKEIVKTWKKHAPNFEKKTLPTKKGITEYRIFYKVEGDAKAPKASLSVYRLLNNGTKERWAILSSNWASKTAVKALSSNIGQGQVVGFYKDRAARGITARGWESNGEDEGVINPLLEDQFTKSVIKGYQNGFKSVQR